MSDAAMLMTAIGGVSKADASYEGGKANQAIDRYNAKNSEIQAEQALEAGSSAISRSEIKSQVLRGAQTSAFAGQGVVATAGTARAVEASSAATSAMDQMMIGINARRQAFGFQVAAANSTFQGELARRAGTEGALSSLIDTGAKETEYADPNYRGKGTQVRNGSLLTSENGTVPDGTGSSMVFA